MTAHRLMYEFRVRSNSARAKLIELLGNNFGKQVPIAEVYECVWGRKQGSTQAFAKLRLSIRKAIVDFNLPYELVEEQRGKRGKTIGLHKAISANEPKSK